MFKTLTLALAVALCLGGAATAGDTVTINLPGGATQTVQGGVLANTLLRSGELSTLTGNSGDGIIASAVILPDGQTVVITTSGGTTYTVASGFLSRLLLSYR